MSRTGARSKATCAMKLDWSMHSDFAGRGCAETALRCAALGDRLSNCCPEVEMNWFELHRTCDKSPMCRLVQSGFKPGYSSKHMFPSILDMTSDREIAELAKCFPVIDNNGSCKLSTEEIRETHKEAETYLVQKPSVSWLRPQ